MSNEIKDYLTNLINSNIDSLNKEKKLVAKLDSNSAVYNVQIWAQDAEEMVYHKFSGSLSEVVTAAELEFKEKNKGRAISPNIYMVDIMIGETRHVIPEKLWNQYRKI